MRLLGLLCLSLFTAFHAEPQAISKRLVFTFLGVQTTKELEAQAKLLENRLISELVRLGIQENFSLVTPKNREALLKDLEFSPSSPEKEPSRSDLDTLPGSRGILAGRLAPAENGLLLHLEILKTGTKESLGSVESKARSIEDLVGDLKAILSRLYDLPEPLSLHDPIPPAQVGGGRSEEPEKDGGAARNVTFRDIAGTWSGDKGLESIKIKSDGSAVANLGGWNTLRLSISLKDDQIVVRQDEPNSPKLYMSTYPYSLAVQIAEAARPMRWVFYLSLDKKMLKGIKETTFLQIDKGKLLQADNSYSREAVWLRSN